LADFHELRECEIIGNPNDIILDAFCGCDTALVAAQILAVIGSASTFRPPPAG
jgi:hypothetical protein